MKHLYHYIRLTIAWPKNIQQPVCANKLKLLTCERKTDFLQRSHINILTACCFLSNSGVTIYMYCTMCPSKLPNPPNLQQMWADEGSLNFGLPIYFHFSACVGTRQDILKQYAVRIGRWLQEQGDILQQGCPNYYTKGRVAVGFGFYKSTTHSLTNQLSGDSDYLIKGLQSGVLLLG